MTHDPILLILDALAAFRLTRLAVPDTITEPLRRVLIGTANASERDLTGMALQIPARPRLADLLHCPWCMGVWIAGLVTAAQALIPDVWLYASVALALAAVAGWLTERS